jgi:hypothetical protein
MAQTNSNIVLPQSSPEQKTSSKMVVVIAVCAVLVVLYLLNYSAVNQWVSDLFSSPTDTTLGGVTSNTNPAAKPATPGTTVAVSATDDSLTPSVKSIEITKDTTSATKPDNSNDDWRTFQIGEVRVYRPDGYVLKAADFDSVAYTAGNVENISQWNQSVIHTASAAVDGDPTTYSHTATNGGNVHQLTLVLKVPQMIAKVEILNRSDCCQARLKGAVVTLKDVQGVVIRSKVLDESMSQILIL